MTDICTAESLRAKIRDARRAFASAIEELVYDCNNTPSWYNYYSVNEGAGDVPNPQIIYRHRLLVNRWTSIISSMGLFLADRVLFKYLHYTGLNSEMIETCREAYREVQAEKYVLSHDMSISDANTRILSARSIEDMLRLYDEGIVPLDDNQDLEDARLVAFFSPECEDLFSPGSVNVEELHGMCTAHPALGDFDTVKKSKWIGHANMPGGTKSVEPVAFFAEPIAG